MFAAVLDTEDDKDKDQGRGGKSGGGGGGGGGGGDSSGVSSPSTDDIPQKGGDLSDKALYRRYQRYNYTTFVDANRKLKVLITLHVLLTRFSFSLSWHSRTPLSFLTLSFLSLFLLCFSLHAPPGSTRLPFPPPIKINPFTLEI